LIRDYLAGAVVLGLSAGISPGPLMALVLSETLRKGAAAGMRVSAAPLITDLPIIGAAVWLMSALSESMVAVGWVSLAGAGTMLWMGWGSLFFNGSGPPNQSREVGSLAKGVLVNLFNPAPYLFWLTVGTPLLIDAAADGAIWCALFLLLFYTCLVGSKMATAIAVDRSRRFLSSRAYVMSVRLLGLLLIGFAVQFVFKAIGYFTQG
jgi:threonine/homoserine/homoserine lactone efflux protein